MLHATPLTIRTRYLRPTDTRGGRITASCPLGRLTVPYDHGSVDPHGDAARALCLARGLDPSALVYVSNTGTGGTYAASPSDSDGRPWVRRNERGGVTETVPAETMAKAVRETAEGKRSGGYAWRAVVDGPGRVHVTGPEGTERVYTRPVLAEVDAGDRTVQVPRGTVHLTGVEALTEVYAADHEGREISDAAAVTLASWWQTPGGTGEVFTRLVSHVPVAVADLHEAIAWERGTVRTANERLALDMLGTWGLNREALTP